MWNVLGDKRKIRKIAEGYLFILPAVLGFMVFTLFSVLFSLYVSFSDWNFSSGLQGIRFNGLLNFKNMASDQWFIDSMLNIVYFAAFVPLQILVALLMAIAIHNKIYFSKTIRTILFMPYVTNAVIIAIVWSMLLNPTGGIVNNFLSTLGIVNPPGWFGSSAWVKPGIVIMTTWSGIGLNVVLFMSGLVGIPKEIYESAEIDGIRTWSRFRYVTFPLISPTTFFIVITSIIGVFHAWAHIQILTGGGPGSSSTVIGYYIYKAAFELGEMGYASAMAWVLFVVVFFFTMVQWYFQKKWVHY